MVYNDASGDNLPDGYENTATAMDLFASDEVVIVEVAKSIPPAVDFDKVLADLSPQLTIELRGWNRGDAGHDTIHSAKFTGFICLDKECALNGVKLFTPTVYTISYAH